MQSQFSILALSALIRQMILCIRKDNYWIFTK